jgi:hypothetical protein
MSIKRIYIYEIGKNIFQKHGSWFSVRANGVKHELQFVFSLADTKRPALCQGVKGGQPFPAFYDFISLTSGFSGLDNWNIKYATTSVQCLLLIKHYLTAGNR